MRFVVEGEHGLERYLGAWGHMLLASSDLIDMMHEHPFLAEGGSRLEFEVVSAPGRLQSLGAVSERRRRQHRSFRCASSGSHVTTFGLVTGPSGSD